METEIGSWDFPGYQYQPKHSLIQIRKSLLKSICPDATLMEASGRMLGAL